MKAELLSQCRGAELAQKYSAWFHELYYGVESAWELIDARAPFPVALVGDADDIFLTLQCDKPYTGSDDSVSSYLEALRGDVKEGRISEYFWVPTLSMTADGGTKAKTDDLMAQVMHDGAWFPSEYKVLTRSPEGSGMVTSSSTGNAWGGDDAWQSAGSSSSSSTAGAADWLDNAGATDGFHAAWSGEATSVHFLGEGCGGRCPCCRGGEMLAEMEARIVYWLGRSD